MLFEICFHIIYSIKESLVFIHLKDIRRAPMTCIQGIILAPGERVGTEKKESYRMGRVTQGAKKAQ